MLADLDTLVTALYVRVDDLLPARRAPRASAANHRRRAHRAGGRPDLSGLPQRPSVPGAGALPAGAPVSLSAPAAGLQQAPAGAGPGDRAGDQPPRPRVGRRSATACGCSTRTPVPCGQSRETARRSELAGFAAYGWCRSHSRYFWGFRLYLLCAPDGMPICFELAPANAPEREVAAEMLERRRAGGLHRDRRQGLRRRASSRPLMAGLGARFLRPDRKGRAALATARSAPSASGSNRSSGPARANSPSKRHGGRTLRGRLRPRRPAPARPRRRPRSQPDIGHPGRHFAAYGH